MSKEQLLKVYAGSTITSSLLNSFVKLFDLFFEVGQSLGTSIRKIKDKKLC